VPEVFVQNANSFAAVFLSLLSFGGHPDASLASLATFLWCLWKARNDQLFGKKIKPEQIALNSKALLHDLVSPLTPNANAALLVTDRQPVPKPGETVLVYFDVAGPKIYIDAVWKLISGQEVARPGLGIYLAIPGDHGAVADVLITTSSSPVASAIQAETQALLLAGHIASSMMLQSPVFFTDCANLARAIAAPGADSHTSLWEIRRHAIEFQNTMTSLSAKVYHIK
jgi:hypothetical protein